MELVSLSDTDKLKPTAASAKTLTFDKGKELAAHAYIGKHPQGTTRSVRPLTGDSSENINGLLHKYTAKKTLTSTVTNEETKITQKKYISRPEGN